MWPFAFERRQFGIVIDIAPAGAPQKAAQLRSKTHVLAQLQVPIDTVLSLGERESKSGFIGRCCLFLRRPKFLPKILPGELKPAPPKMNGINWPIR